MHYAGSVGAELDVALLAGAAGGAGVIIVLILCVLFVIVIKVKKKGKDYSTTISKSVFNSVRQCI